MYLMIWIQTEKHFSTAAFKSKKMQNKLNYESNLSELRVKLLYKFGQKKKLKQCAKV